MYRDDKRIINGPYYVTKGLRFGGILWEVSNNSRKLNGSAAIHKLCKGL